MMTLCRIALVAATFFLPAAALAHVPECYEHIERRYDDGTTNKGGGGMYDTNFLRGWVYGKVQEMDDTERRNARTYPGIASLIGPCLLPDGTIHHMVDQQSR